MIGPNGPLEAELAAALQGRYTIERDLGGGGMARVSLARDGRHGRPVAIKTLRPEIAALLGDRFLREIEILANLTHPNILPLFDSGQAGSLVYFVWPMLLANQLLTPFALLERARRAPSAADARELHAEFLRRYDLPPPAHRPLVDEAVRAVGGEPRADRG